MGQRLTRWMAALAVLVPAAVAAAQDAKLAPSVNELPVHVIKVLRTTNKAQTHRYIPKVYDIHNTNPYALLRWVRRTAQIEEGGFYFFGKPDADGKINSGKIMVTLPEHMIPGVDALMQTIDRAGLTSTSGEEFLYFRPKHRHTHDAGFKALISAIKGNSGDFETDDPANCVLVYAAPSKIKDVENQLYRFDVPPPQVVIEATVYEVFVDNESKIGLDYVAWKNGPGRNLFASSVFGEHGTVSSVDDAPVLDPGSPTVTGSYSGTGHNSSYFLDIPSAFFDFLVVKGKARVMTSAKVTTRNGLTATLETSDTILYYHTRVGETPAAGFRAPNQPLDPYDTATVEVQTSGEAEDVAAQPDNRTVVSTQVTRELTGAHAGVELEVTPTVGTAEIELEIETSVVSHTGFDDKGAPVLAERTVKTEVACKSGQEIILGGYARETMIERADKVPLLGSLPLIGYLFGGDANTTERRQVVVVLTPHRVTDFSAMTYDPTKINAALIKSKALKKTQTKVPHTEVGFDQWILDAEETRR